MRHTNLHSILQKLWVLCCTLVLVFAHSNASAQVFQNTLMLQSTDEYCAGLSGYDTPTNNATRFYMSVGNTTTGSPAATTLNRILLTKYDVNGNILWTKTIHVPGANSSWYATDIQAGFNTTTTEISSTTVLPTPTPVYGMDDAAIAVPNNQSVYYISGYTLYKIPNTNTTIKRMILVKVDAAGNVLWTRTNFTNSNTFDEAGVSVETAPNGDVFIVGSARNTSNNRFHVSVGRVRPNGTLVWFNRYANSTNVAQSMNPKQSITTKDLVPNATGAIVNATGIAITGEYRNTSVSTSVNRAFTMRIYFNGTEVWRRGQTLSGTQTSSGQDLIVDPTSNNLTVVGYNGNVTTNTARTIFWQLSGAGNQIASIVYNNPNQASHYAQSIVPALNTAVAGGGFAVAGSIRVSNAGAVAANRTYLLQLAANGAPNWMRYYQRTTPRFNATESVVSSLSGYYLSTNATKTGTPDAHVISTDPAGMLPGASPADCREIDASLTAQNLGDFTTIPLGQTATTPITSVTLTAVTIDHPQDRCAPVTVVCPNCNDFSVTMGDCTSSQIGTTRQVSFGLLCTIPAGATGTMTWSFGDGSPNYTGPLVSVIHNYAPGTYSVCAYGTIILADGTQCPFDYCKTITVEDCDPCPSCSDFTYQVACVPSTSSPNVLVPQVTFNVNCTPSTTIAGGSVWWDFGDGSSGSYPYGPVTHTYPATGGTYNVCHRVEQITLANGDICEVYDYILCQTIVVPPCSSPCPNCNDFSVSIGDCVYTGTAAPTRQVGLGLLCAIPAGATGTMTWSFGDGSPNYTGPLASVIHNYAPGTYSVCAYGTIVLANGTQCPFDYCKTIVIPPCDNPCPTCTDMTVTQGDCVYNAATNTSTRQVGFSMNCAIPSGATINATWSWGDGTANYTYSGLPMSVIHNYAPGTYNVCTYGTITLSNGQICQFEICKTIVVEPCPNPCPTCNSFTVVQGECVATATGGFVRQMGFSITCPIPAGATINATWVWGDGSPNYTYSGLPMSVIHNYAPGTYNVCTYGTIILANGQQCFFEFCQQVVVEPCQNPCPTCNTINATVTCVQVAGSTTLVPQATLSLGCTFPTGSTGTATWIWGDGSASQTVTNLSPVTHIYAPGTYNVCVSISVTLPTGQVCNYQFCRSLTVTGCTNGCPTCQLSWQVACCTPPPPIPISNPINYTATFGLACNIPTSATITWQFGDGSPSQTGASTITHSYGAAGTYNVCAIVQTPNLTCDYCTTITIASTLCASPIPTCSTNPSGKTTVTETWKFGVNVAPNPFANNTNIEYSLPEATAVTIEVYSITGQKVTTITNNEQHEAGTYIANFDAANLTAGTYYCTVQAGKYSVVKPLVLIK